MEEQLSFAQLTTVELFEYPDLEKELIEHDVSSDEIHIEDNSIHDDELDLNEFMVLNTSPSNIENSSAFAKACNVINQIAAGSLGKPNFSQRYNFNNSDINTGSQPINQNVSNQFLESKENSVTRSVLEPTEIIFPKIGTEIIPTLYVVGDSIKSFFDQLIDKSILRNKNLDYCGQSNNILTWIILEILHSTIFLRTTVL